MRVLLDTNILISYLLPKSTLGNSVGTIVNAAVDGRFTIVLPVELVDELELTVSTKRYLRAHISEENVETLLAILRSAGDSLPKLTGPATSLVRDQKDNYLLAAAAIGDVDVLVTGDLDLLVLRDRLKRPTIMTPAEFALLLDQREGNQD